MNATHAHISYEHIKPIQHSPTNTRPYLTGSEAANRRVPRPTAVRTPQSSPHDPVGQSRSVGQSGRG